METHEDPTLSENNHGERPLECSECKKPVSTRYTEIHGNHLNCTSMCSDCPVLQKRLFGFKRDPISHMAEGSRSLACGNCGTTLESIKMGALLGCESCYEVFEEVILTELTHAKKLPPRVNVQKKSAPIHIGRAPGEVREFNPQMRLLALNEALTETLKSEDYEQAAKLRDQIKALSEEGKEGGKS